MVLAVHQGQLFKGCGLYELSKLGQLGCQCFFVISGFTLCQSWDSRNSTTLHFLRRRFTAIAPGYYFDILLFTFISAIIQYFNLPHYWSQFDNGIPGWGHIANFLFVHGMSPDWINTIVPGGWYIGTTMLMYLTFPIMKKLLEIIHSRNDKVVLLLPWCFTAISISFWYLMVLYFENMEVGNNTFAYFNILTQYPCFIIGGALYTFTNTHGFLKSRNSLIRCLIFAFVFLAVTILLFYSGKDFLFCIVPVCAASFFACAMLMMIKIIDIDGLRLPTSISQIINKISGVSYEMYLLHTLFAYFIAYYLRKLLKQGGVGAIFDYSATYIVFLICLVTFSYFSGKALKTLLNYIFQKDKHK